MTVGRICVREVDVARADEPVQEAARRMAERRVGSLAVLDERQHPVGIVTDRDLALRVVGQGRDAWTTRVEDVMSAHPRTVAEATPIEDALRTMRSLGVRRLPVVGEGGELVGILCMDDVLSLLAEEMRLMGDLLEKSSPAGALF